MGVIAALDGARVVAWTCLVIGVIVMGAGVVIGVWTSLRKPTTDATKLIAEAQSKLEEAQAGLAEARQQIQDAEESGLESLDGAAVTGVAGAATEAAAASTKDAKSALEQVQGLVGALPENLRFAGMLVLVGAVLMSVATIQFGGTSLF